MTSMDRKAFAKILDNFRRERGMTQTELARQLRVSQPHLSRVISGSVPVGDKLRFRANRLLTVGHRPEQQIAWLKKVSDAATQSPAFRRLVNSALQMLENE
jgi:transcriptional regulator with XRE-family HTH domain